MRAAPAAIRDLVHALDAAGRFRVPSGELSIALLDARAMGRLHAKHLGDPAPTDVITFDGDPLFDAAGEICVCAEVARDYAQAHGHDFASELALYIAHGYLHLAGFDDTTPALRARMREAERDALAILAAARAVPAFSLARRRRGNAQRAN